MTEYIEYLDTPYGRGQLVEFLCPFCGKRRQADGVLIEVSPEDSNDVIQMRPTAVPMCCRPSEEVVA